MSCHSLLTPSLHNTTTVCPHRYILETTTEVKSKGLLWSLMDQSLPTIKDSIKGARVTKDRHGIVFDVPNENVSVCSCYFPLEVF
jgi:hypothetical protein